MRSKVIRARKIALNPFIHKVTTLRSHGGNSQCDHDFEDMPTTRTPATDTWTCTRCAREFECDHWPVVDERDKER